MLDTTLLDIRDSTKLFSIKTVGNQTTLHRAAVNGKMVSHAAVHWPTSTTNYSKKEKDATVFIDGVSMPSSAFLKKSLLGGGTRKFHIPGQSNPLKWKFVGSHWECTLCSHACTAHRAVATFEPAHTTAASRLAIYTQGVRRHDDHKPHEQYDNVDMDMLVYLILTSMLLTTPAHAWQDLQSTAYPSPALSEKLLSKHTLHHQHKLTSAPMITTNSPKTNRLDLLGDDHCPASVVQAHSPIRGSPSSSCYSSLPPSPLTPSMDLSPIHHDTFAPSSSSNTSCPLVFRRNSNRLPSPLVTHSISSCSSSPTSATPTTAIPAGPSAITPYHLPPSTPSTPHSLHPHHSLPYHHHHQQAHPQRSHTSNALHLDTSHLAVSPVPYTTQMYHLQFAGDEDQPQPRQHQISSDELPPAYSEIEWTVRVKQPRSQLRLHTAPVA